MAEEFNPSVTSSDYDAMCAYWQMVRTILAGEGAIKKAGRKYLPQFKNEKDSIYDARLAHSPFTNIYADISRNLASKPFAEECKLKEGSPERYVALSENIDGQGNNLHVFAAATFKNALDYAIDWILVDYTRAKPRPDGRPLTLADEQEQGLRPYWVSIPAERMLAVYSEFIGGKEIIYHARIKETTKQVEADFQEVCVERVRVLSREPIYDEETGAITGFAPATWELWEQKTNRDNQKSWVRIDGGNITIGIIPLVPVVLTTRIGGSWIVEPPLRDLAYLQMTEYRQESALEWVKIMTCYPMVCISGMETKDAEGNQIEVTVGPNTAFLIPQNNNGTGPAGEVKIVEPGAQSVKENREQLELTRKEMRDLGMQPMTQSALTVVTTANVSQKASSAVQAWAYLFKDAIELAWKYTALWLNDVTFEPEIDIFTDFQVETEKGKEIDALLKAEQQHIYSKKTVREEFRRRNIVVNEISDEEEEQRIALETEGLEPDEMEMIDPRTGQPVRQPEAVQ